MANVVTPFLEVIGAFGEPLEPKTLGDLFWSNV